MIEIEYIVGDMFPIIAENPNRIVIPHVCNDIGAFGAGFVVPLGKHFPKAKDKYLEWAKSDWKTTGIPFKLGETQYVRVNDKITVMNMVGQRACGHDATGRPPIRYTALVRCLQNVASVAEALDAEIHAPKFGSDLAGGDWNFIEQLIIECWCDRDIPVTIYSLEPIIPPIGPASDYVGDPITEGGAELLDEIPLDIDADLLGIKSPDSKG